MNMNVFKLGQEAWILLCCSLWADLSLLTQKLEGRLVWLNFPLVSVVLLLVCVACLCVLGLHLAWLHLQLASPVALPYPLVAAMELNCPLCGCKLACAISLCCSQATKKPTNDAANRSAIEPNTILANDKLQPPLAVRLC